MKPVTEDKQNADTAILLPNTIDIWTIGLQTSDSCLASYRNMLTQRERDRADRLRFDRDRHRYTVGRGAMRTVLSRYLNIEPASVLLTYGGHGKPALAKRTTVLGADSGDIQFNLSHSHDTAMLAVNAAHPVGIDIERVRDNVDHAGLADRFFSKREVQLIRELPPAQHLQAFFVVWTRKEAWLKAHGKGISVSLSSFDVSAQLANGLSNALLCDPPETNFAPNWQKVDIEDPTDELWFDTDLAAPVGYIAALSTDRATASLRFFEYA
jgi:4'-phosphopantetheinyl transferase